MKKELGTFKGKTVKEAVLAAIEATGVSAEAIKYDVLEEGKSGFLGIGATKAEIAAYVEVEETEEVAPMSEIQSDNEAEEGACEPEVEQSVSAEEENGAEGKSDGERAVEFLEGLLKLLEIKASPSLVSEGEKILINLSAEKTHDVIGKRGITLDAIQNLAGAVANIGRDDYKRVVVDCDGYRTKRDETLAHVANKTADKAIRLAKKVSLEPMCAYERRIIHATLAERTDVKTVSEGKEPRRYIVVIPSNVKYANEKPTRADRLYKGKKPSGKGGKPAFNKDKRRDGEKREFKKDFKKPHRQYTEEEKAARSRVGGGTGVSTNGNNGSTYKRSSSVVFGTYLGNSRKNGENKD